MGLSVSLPHPHVLFCPLRPLLRQQGSTYAAVSRTGAQAAFALSVQCRGKVTVAAAEGRAEGAASVSGWEGGGESSKEPSRLRKTLSLRIRESRQGLVQT